MQMWGALNGMAQTKALIETRFPHSSQSTNSDYEGPVLVSPVLILLIVTYLWQGHVYYLPENQFHCRRVQMVALNMKFRQEFWIITLENSIVIVVMSNRKANTSH